MGNPQDNEDVPHLTAARDPSGPDKLQFVIANYTPNVDRFLCGLCGGDQFIILAAYDETSLFQMICAKPRCPGRTKVMEMRKPQMSDAVAKRLGIWTPSRVPLIEDTMDLHD